MLYYLPLEPYVERYTYFMSQQEGWAEVNFKRFSVPFTRVEGIPISETIKDGVVLDACGRSYYAMTQILRLVEYINEGKLTDDDIVYVEDFWHPGIESLFYIRHLKKMKFKIGTFIHAQSVDDTDFSYAMRDWMRPIEQGFGKQYDYIFTCSPILKKLCIDAGIGTADNIFYVGLPYNSNRLLEQLSSMSFVPKYEKDRTVLFSSRFDDEKDPMFFLDLVEACPDVSFLLVNPRKDRPITVNKVVYNRLMDIVNKNESNLRIIDTSSKIEYYKALDSAKVQFNCAHQDWVSWTLLEAVTFKCNPLYPIWKDFPQELQNDDRYLYKKRDLQDCKNKLYALLDTPFDSKLNQIVEKHDDSWHKYLRAMGLIKGEQ